MAGEFSGEVNGGGDNCMSVLRRLGREEILEVLADGFCQNCQSALQSRINSFINKKVSGLSVSNSKTTESSTEFWSIDASSSQTLNKSTSWGSAGTPESVYLGRQKGYIAHSSPSLVNSKQSSNNLGSNVLHDGPTVMNPPVDNELLEEQKEHLRFKQIGRQKDFLYLERIDGRPTNVLKGIELHTRVFDAEEQKKIVECVYNLQRMGQKGQLKERTYSEPRKWMRGKGRVTMQFGCCYNYAVDRNGNPPGILREEDVDPLPPLFKQMIKRMVRWHVLPPTCVPNSCIVNIYDEGDCIPPHIDHHDFLRPFCTVSFLTECNILFGANLKILGPGEFEGPFSIPLPVGSVLILNGNGADIAKHCVPGVPSKRISITFRRMDNSKIPYNFTEDPELHGIKPLGSTPPCKSPVQQNSYKNGRIITQSPVQQNSYENKRINTPQNAARSSDTSFLVAKEFPPLGISANKRRTR
ncbi:hypothetical protein LguiB_021861 [Lonicera macranthoides]